MSLIIFQIKATNSVFSIVMFVCDHFGPNFFKFGFENENVNIRNPYNSNDSFILFNGSKFTATEFA